jgi:hypothetical protein
MLHGTRATHIHPHTSTADCEGCDEYITDGSSPGLYGETTGIAMMKNSRGDAVRLLHHSGDVVVEFPSEGTVPPSKSHKHHKSDSRSSSRRSRADADKYHAHETKKSGARSKLYAMCVAGCITFGVVLMALISLSRGSGHAPLTERVNMVSKLSQAQKFTNCTDFGGAVHAVQIVAEAKSYLHQFEYDRLHPCCVLRNTRLQNTIAPLDASDIVFIVLTSAKTQSKAKAVLDTWGKGLENLLLISDEANPELHTISYDQVAGSSSGVGASSKADTVGEEQHTQIWAMKLIYENDQYMHLRNKRWYFLADDDSWVNIPALLQLASQYDFRCPVMMGYVWSKVWIEDLDYLSGGAGMLLSQEAFNQLSPAFYTEECPFSHNYNEITFGRCAWARKIQLVHQRGFFYDPPERSKDRHEVVWFPPIAEAVTYHYVHPDQMQLMTNYANNRWMYTPTIKGNSTFLSITPALLKNLLGSSRFDDFQKFLASKG